MISAELRPELCRYQKDRKGEGKSHEKAMAATRLKVKCYHCGKCGHIKRNCYLLKRRQPSQGQRPQQKATKAATKKPTSDDKNDALIATHALQARIGRKLDSRFGSYVPYV